LEVLGRAGVPVYEVEGDVMRSLTADELAVIEAATA
jgi:hypothetical protein